MGTLTWLRRGAASALAFSLMLSGCDSSSPPTPESMTASPSSVIDGTVGQNVSVSVTVTGSDGKPYAGGVVSFTVTSGGGTVSPTSATTDQSGRASATWTLGQTAGTQQLTASLSPASATFQANAGAGAPASIQALTSYPGTYDPGEDLPQDANFEVEDQYGNEVSGASVSFSASHDGTVSPTQGTTDSQGQASTTWTLGPRNGTQTLTATVASVTPATLNAEAYDPCLDVQTLVIGGTITGNLSAESCETEVDNTLRFLDWYGVTISNAGAFIFTLASDFATPAFRLYDNGGFMGGLIDTNDNVIAYRAFLDTDPQTSGAQPAAAASETYLAGVFSNSGGVGDYTLEAVASSGQIENCETWVSTGLLSTNQSLATTDCGFDDGSFFDRIILFLDQGETIRVAMNSSAVDAFLMIVDAGWTEALDGDDDSGVGTNALVDFSAPERNYYWVVANSFGGGETGNYSLTINPLTSSPPQGAAGPTDPRRLPMLPDELPDPGRALLNVPPKGKGSR